MAICILVLEQEETVFELWESIKNFPTQISKYQVIEAISKKSQNSMTFKRLKHKKLKFIEFNKVNISSSQIRKN